MKRRKTYIEDALSERVTLSRFEYALVLGAISVVIACMLVVLIGGPLGVTAKAPGTLGPERSDRAYCWYVSDPCSPHNQLTTK